MCVCVCERERERERTGGELSGLYVERLSILKKNKETQQNDTFSGVHLML